MRLRVIAVGKLKDRGLEAIVADYVKRCRPLMPLDVVEVKSHSALRTRAGDRPVVLDERGVTPTSTELARWLSQWRDAGVRELDFLIGDAHGFSDADRGGARRLLALSRLTLPHRLARVVLVEQLYRACTIVAGHPYHH